MSLPLDPSVLAQSDVQIRILLGEITQLSQRDIAPEEFHAEFLRRAVDVLSAVGGALWIFDGNNLALAYQINFKELQLQGDNTEKHTRLLYQMLRRSETAMLLPPHSGEGDDELGNPTDHLLIFGPIRTELETVGLVEIIHRSDASPAAQKNFTQFLAQMCRYATDYYKNRQLRHFGERQNLWTVLEDFTRTIHQSLDPRRTAYAVANEGRRLIDCDRVSVALCRGRTCPITAVSGQDTVNKRSTTVRLLGKLATAVFKAGEPIVYTGDTSDFPPQIERTLENYVDESHCKMVAVQPLFQRKREDNEDRPLQRRKRLRPFGVLIVEQIEDSQVTERTRKRITIVADHAGSALGNALEHQSIFLLPLWKLLGKSKKLVVGETLPKTFAVTALLVALIAILVFMPYPFQMHCTGTLEPVLRQRIYSQLESEIEKLYVDHNTPVVGPSDGYRGTTLLTLRSPELDALEVQLYGEEQEINEELASLTRILMDQDRQLTDYRRAELLGQQSRAEIRLKTVQHKRHIFYQLQKPNLFITSPMRGVVISGDVKRRLTEKLPISRMQYVMEIADLEGPWQLELLMPEKRMGYLAKQQEQQPGVPLRVEFISSADPAQEKHYGTITEIHDRAEVRSQSDNTNTVAIKVALEDVESLRHILRSGAECTARINCGRKPLGYVLFYEVIVYVKKNILFRWF